MSLRRVVGDFYTEQLQAAGHVYLSFTENMDGEKLEQVEKVLREIHPGLAITEKPLNGITREDFPEGEEIPGNRRNAKENSLFVSEGLESAEKFGDSFQEELRDFPEDKMNLFVAIGGRRSILELNRRLAERFAVVRR